MKRLFVMAMLGAALAVPAAADHAQDDLQAVKKAVLASSGSQARPPAEDPGTPAGATPQPRKGEPMWFRPPPAFYEDFPQIENGVGMLAAFLQDVRRTRLPRGVSAPLRMTAVTGRSFAPFLREAFRRLEAVEGVSTRVLAVRNRLFGPSVTVTGLLSGSDIMRSIAGRRLGDLLLVPESTLQEGHGVFLDDRTVDELEHAAGVPVRVVGSFRDVVQIDRQERRQRGAA